MVGAGTGAGVVGARGEMMETMSERMKAKSVIIILSCGVVWCGLEQVQFVGCLERSVRNVLNNGLWKVKWNFHGSYL